MPATAPVSSASPATWSIRPTLGDNHDRAALELKAACYFVRFVDEHTPEVVEIRKLQEEEGWT